MQKPLPAYLRENGDYPEVHSLRFLSIRIPDQFDRNAGGGAFLRVTDGVLDVTNSVDYVIDSRVRVAADMDQGFELSNLIVERRANGDAVEPTDSQVLFRRQQICAWKKV